MNIKIIFNENNSPKFEEIISNCQKFQDFYQDRNSYIIEINENEIRPKKKLIKGIISRIKDWNSSKFYIDEKMVSSHDLEQALEVYFCESKNQKYTPSCSGGEGWGCRLLKSVYCRNAQKNPKSRKNWYNFGSFDKGDWLIDKALIEKTLKEEIKSKNLTECSLFLENNIDQVLQSLPTRINPDHDPDWQYRYSSNGNGTTREIVGVKPKKKSRRKSPFDDLGDLFSDSPIKINISDVLDSFGDFGLSDDSDSLGDNPFSDLFDLGSTKNRSGRSIPDTTFEDIGGMDEIIQQVKEIIELPIIAPDLLEYYNIKPHKGILLYGPPGCGKTLLAKAVANEINAHFISISGPEILNKYVGQSEENLRHLFNEAISKAPSIVYFDEFDSLGSHRNQEMDPHNSRLVNQILTLMDGIDDKSKICIIASTNRIDMIDEAIKRPGRFDYVLEVSKPSLDGCKQIFNIYTQKMPIEEGFDKEEFVTEYLFGSSGAEIAFVATEAAYNSIRRTVDIDSVLNGEDVKISDKNIVNRQDFLKAVEALNSNRENSQQRQKS